MHGDGDLSVQSREAGSTGWNGIGLLVGGTQISMVKCIFQWYLRSTSIATYMLGISIAVSTISSVQPTIIFRDPVATVKRASGKGPALVINSLGQTRGMRAYDWPQ